MRIACERHVRGELRCTWYLLPPAAFEAGSDEQRNPRRRQKRKDRHDSEPMRGCAWRHVWLEGRDMATRMYGAAWYVAMRAL